MLIFYKSMQDLFERGDSAVEVFLPRDVLIMRQMGICGTVFKTMDWQHINALLCSCYHCGSVVHFMIMLVEEGQIHPCRSV